VEKLEKYKISFEVRPTEAYDNILGLLELIQTLGTLGASRMIGITDEDRWKSFMFDGDGNHRIENIKGEILTSKDCKIAELEERIEELESEQSEDCYCETSRIMMEDRD